MQTTKKRQLPLFHIEEQESSPPTPTPWEKAGERYAGIERWWETR